MQVGFPVGLSWCDYERAVMKSSTEALLFSCPHACFLLNLYLCNGLVFDD